MNTKSHISSTCQIPGGFTLVAADPKVFVNHYTIYKNGNPFNRFNWEHHRYAITDSSPCYWVYRDNLLVGGALIQANSLSGVFVVPPFNNFSALLRALTHVVIECSDKTLPIRAVGVLHWQLEAFTRHGFRIIEGKRNMVRPTEVLPYSFAPEFEVLSASAEYEKLAVELLQEAYRGNAGRPITLEECVETVHGYYHTFLKKAENLSKASSLVFDRASGQLVGLCHVMEWEGWPMVDDVVVRPSYHGQGLATAMLRKAITETAPYYPAIRLFVTVGNPAQSVYYNLGFNPAPEFYELEIPPQLTSDF